MGCESIISQRRGVLRWSGAVPLLLLYVSPAVAVSHTISTGVVVYDSGTFGSDDIDVDGTGTTLQVLAGTPTLGNAIRLTNGATLDNAGRIERHGPGVSAETGTVVNRDGSSITSTGDFGVYFELGGSVTNEAGASIVGTTGVFNDWPVGAGIGTVTNSGTITGTAGSGVDLENGGVVINKDGGLITGTVDGVDVWGPGSSVTNIGGSKIIADPSHNGIWASAGSADVVNSGAGSQISGWWGVYLDSGGSVTNDDGADITGLGTAAIYLSEGGAVTNGAGSSITGSTDPMAPIYGIYASQSATVSNAGSIVGDVRLADQRENHVTLFTGSRVTGDLYISTLDDDSTLTLDGEGTQLYSDAVSGLTTFVQGGTLIKKGGGTWIIDTSSSGGLAPAAIVIEDGTLEARNNSALTGGTLTLQAGGRLGGTGQVGKLVVRSGGTVAPGNSTGTLVVNGAYQPASGSIYEAEVSGDGTSDLINASGAATIASGAELKAKKYGAEPLIVGTRYTVLTASSRTGAYTLLDGGALTAFLAAEASYDSRHAYLTISQSRNLDTAAATPNQRAAAAGLQSTPTGDAARIAVLNLPDDDSARAAFDQLSGEIHASVREGLLAEARAPREAALARLRTLLATGDTLWSEGYGAVGRIGGDGNGAPIDNRSGGFLFGADLPTEGGGRIGVFGGAGYDGIAARGTATSTDVTIGAYGGARLGAMAIRGGLATTAHAITTTRSADLAGYSADIRSTYGGTTAQAFAELAAPFSFGPVTLSPFAGVSSEWLRTNAIDEAGGVHGDAADSHLGATVLGLDASASFGWLAISGHAGWQHIVATTPSTATLSLAGGSPFTVAAAPLPSDSGIFALDLDLSLSDSATLTVRYDGSMAATGSSQALSAQLRGTF